MTAEHLLSAYIDINIVFGVVAIAWFVTKRLLAMSRLHDAYKFKLHILYGLLALVVLAPLAILGLDASQSADANPHRASLTFSDFLVAQYLNGNIALAPTEFERLLMFRSDFIHQVASLSTTVSYAIVAGLGIGFTAILYRIAHATSVLRRMIGNSFVHRRIGKIDIRFTHETCVPFSTRGLFRHYIVLPTALLTQKNDVRIAVIHEIQHIRQRDLTWEVLLELARPFFFWNPAYHLCKRDVERLRELSCDQSVLARHTHLVRDYCECLLRICKTSLTGDRTNQIITPTVPFAQVDTRRGASHSGTFLKQRVALLLDCRDTGVSKQLYRCFMAGCIVVVLAASFTLRPTNDWSHDRLMLSTIVNLERLNSRSVVVQP